MDRHIEVVGVDHGWSRMKTVSQVFTTGVKEITTEPAFYNNVVEFNGSYYKVGGKRLEVRDLKVENDNFYIRKRQILMRSDTKLPQPFVSWSNSL